MRDGLAGALVQRPSRVPADSSCRKLCASLAFGAAAKENAYPYGASMARLCAAVYSPPAPLVAQLGLAEETPMVRRRIVALPAPAYRRYAVVLTLLFLCACAPVLAPRGAGSDAALFQQGAFVTRDGLRLPVRHWDAARPTAIIVALHGMSDYSQAFDLPGPWWAAHGVSVYAYDQRGFGGAPDRGLWAGEAAMRQDLGDMVDALRA